MVNLLAVVVHAANIHETKSGISAAKDALDKYPLIQWFCADAGYQKIFEKGVSQGFGLGVDIVARTQPGWEVMRKRWIVERSLAWLTISVVFPKILRYLSVPLKLFVPLQLSALY